MRLPRLWRSEPAARREPTFAPRNASPENPSTSLANPDQWLIDWSGGGGNTFGPPVSERTSMQVSTVFRCVSLISGIIAGLPLKIYRDDPVQGRVEVVGNSLNSLLGIAPWPGRSLSAFGWREMWCGNTLLHGNHYSAIRYNNAGRILGFEAMADPNLVDVVQIVEGPRAGQNAYVFRWPGREKEVLPAEDVLHIPGIGFDGIKGMSRIRHFARNAVSLSKVFEEQTGRVHENQLTPSGAFEVPAGVTPEGMRRMEAYITGAYAGRSNARKPLFLDVGSKFTPFAISSEDLQTLESRRFQVEEVCRFYGVPPHMVGESGAATSWGTGIEQMAIGFRIYTLEPEMQRIEAELRLKLFAGTSLYARFDREALDALDAVSAAQAAAAELNSGALLINERRKQKHRPAVAGGDVPLVQGAMRSLETIIKAPAVSATPQPLRS